jgi:hypothetical protein
VNRDSMVVDLCVPRLRWLPRGNRQSAEQDAKARELVPRDGDGR